MVGKLRSHFKDMCFTGDSTHINALSAPSEEIFIDAEPGTVEEGMRGFVGRLSPGLRRVRAAAFS